MAFRLYIVPIVGVGTKEDPRRPKYFNGRDGIITEGQDWSAIDYGFEPWMVVGADLSTSDDNLVVGQSDAFAVPFDLATQLTSQQVTSVQNKLEAINVPAGWVTTSFLWIEVVRIVLGMFLFMQRYVSTHGSMLFTGGTTLSTRINQLTQGERDDLTSAATSLGLSTTGIIGSTTLRAALKILADQFTTMPYHFGNVTL